MIPFMLIVPIVFLFILIAVGMNAFQGTRDRADVARWADEQGYLIEEIEKTWFDKGPYWVKGKRRIYRCRVRDAQGNQRLVYMRTRFFGNEYELFDR